VPLAGHLWRASNGDPIGAVIVNPATGVHPPHYHPHAPLLAGHGFDVLTYDYRGIGLSRPSA